LLVLYQGLERRFPACPASGFTAAVPGALSMFPWAAWDVPNARHHDFSILICHRGGFLLVSEVVKPNGEDVKSLVQLQRRIQTTQSWTKPALFAQGLG
jgi:hypothetical protein